MIPKRRTILGCMVFAVTIVIILGTAGYLYLQSARYESGLNAARTWARLNEFPATAVAISVESSGGLFTRELTVTFVAPLEDIDSWIDRSPGTQDVEPTTKGAVRTYKIKPGGGAQHAELEVDERTRTVKINTYWS